MKNIFDKIRKEYVTNIAKELVNVQPINPGIVEDFTKYALDEKDLIRLGYKPACELSRLIWVKDDNEE